MGAGGATEPTSISAPRSAPARAAASASPVAVVWCRQVDNEAESPGYTTVPEEFPGQRETLEVVRSVGHLTVNVADTHDYWDPDPAQPLSYYPNLFLYPAYGGRYTCVGRMFLSTEDRPRLGMKTLVLDTGQLFASGEFGATVLRWHASMGGPRREGSRPPPAPDPTLIPVLGEGFLFHRGSTDPVVVVAADEWERTMQTILELVRVLPASLVALGAILAFPYFLPQPKTNLHEFTEQLPLALALMRVPKGEAAGDRHAKRMSSWATAPVTLRDLTDGVPAARGRETVPLVLQYARDRVDTKLLPISQRVDLVELSRVRGHLADPERQAGRDRRKEMWRIGTAMESAALLLQRARGRHVPVNVETAKRAQEYLQARLPEVDPNATAPLSEPAVVEPPVGAGATVAASLPPWLRGPLLPPAPPPPAAPEVVPISIAEDPSLLSPSARSAAPAAARPAPAAPAAAPARTSSAPPPSAPPRPPPAATPAPVALPADPVTPRPAPTSAPVSPPPAAPVPEPARPPAVSTADLVTLRGQLQQDLFRLLEDRIAALPKRLNTAPATRLDDALLRELEARTEARVRAAVDEANAKWTTALGAVEGRQAAAVERRLAEIESKQPEATRLRVADEVDRRLPGALQTPLTEAETRLAQTVEAAQGRQREALRAAFEQAVVTLRTQLNESETTLRTALQADLDRSLTEGPLRTEVEGLIAAAFAARLTEAETRRSHELRDLELRLGAQLDARLKETAQRVEALTKETAQAPTQFEGRLTALFEQARRETTTLVATAVTTRLAEIDQRRLRETRDLEQRVTQTLEARLKESLEKGQGASSAVESRLATTVDQRIALSEDRQRAALDGKLEEVHETRVQALAELQVRLQSFFEQRIGEAQERERQKYVELLARLKSEVDAGMSRMVDSSRFDAALREKVGRTLEAVKAEQQRALDARLATAEERLKVDQTEVTEHLTRLEAALEDRRAELQALDESIRAEVDDLDRRTQILSDRLVPIVRKTWLRVAELQQASGPSAEAEALVHQLRRDITRELHRLDAELLERTTEIRDRMETAISSQGRVWLTLIRQLSQLTGRPRSLAASPLFADDAEALRRLSGALDAESDDPSDPVNPLDPDPEHPLPTAPSAEPTGRGDRPPRRLRRPTR